MHWVGVRKRVGRVRLGSQRQGGASGRAYKVGDELQAETWSCASGMHAKCGADGRTRVTHGCLVGLSGPGGAAEWAPERARGEEGGWWFVVPLGIARAWISCGLRQRCGCASCVCMPGRVASCRLAAMQASARSGRAGAGGHALVGGLR